MSSELNQKMAEQINGFSACEPLKLDLRQRRDLFGRRFGSELRRRILRCMLLLLTDSLTTLGSAVFVYWAASGFGPLPRGTLIEQLPLLVVLVLLGQMAAASLGPVRQPRSHERVGLGLLYSMGALVLLAAADAVVLPGPGPMLLLSLLLGVGLMGARLVLRTVVTRFYRRGIGVKNTLVVASNEEAWQLIERFRAAREDDARIVGHLSRNYAQDPTALGPLEDLPRMLEELNIQNVIVSTELSPSEFVGLVSECFVHGAAVSVIPTTQNIPARVSGRNVMGWPLLELNIPRLHMLQLTVKRTLDIVGALIGMLVLSPILLLTALAVRLEGKPVLFRQQRLGVGGREFTIYKFRSMRPDAERALRADPALYEKYIANNFKLPPDEDPRISWLGGFLRRTSLDELPQLLNVLKGEMSLVGPRPIVPPEIDAYGDDARTFLAVKPGVTGWWQVNGRSEVGYPERANLDIQYIQRWSLLLDMKILLLTLRRIRTGAH